MSDNEFYDALQTLLNISRNMQRCAPGGCEEHHYRQHADQADAMVKTATRIAAEIERRAD
jgi:hypothetical protein